MMILLFGVLNDEQRALVERIFHEHRVHFQRISFKIVKSEEAAEDVVSTAFVKIMDNIEKISELPCPQMTAFCVTISTMPFISAYLLLLIDEQVIQSVTNRNGITIRLIFSWTFQPLGLVLLPVFLAITTLLLLRLNRTYDIF